MLSAFRRSNRAIAKVMTMPIWDYFQRSASTSLAFTLTPDDIRKDPDLLAHFAVMEDPFKIHPEPTNESYLEDLQKILVICYSKYERFKRDFFSASSDTQKFLLADIWNTTLAMSNLLKESGKGTDAIKNDTRFCIKEMISFLEANPTILRTPSWSDYNTGADTLYKMKELTSTHTDDSLSCCERV